MDFFLVLYILYSELNIGLMKSISLFYQYLSIDTQIDGFGVYVMADCFCIALFISLSLSAFFVFFFSSIFGHLAAYGNPQPGITSKSEPQLRPTLQLWQHWILYPLCWAEDQSNLCPGTAETSIPLWWELLSCFLNLNIIKKTYSYKL